MPTEPQVRRRAHRGGFHLAKSRTRDPERYDFGGFMLINDDTNCVMIGGSPLPFGAGLDDVVDWLDHYEAS